MVERKQFVATTFWDTTQPQGSIIGAYPVPFSLINSKSMKPAWENNIFWRGTAIVSVQLQSTAFVTGKLALVWAPLMDTAQATATYGGRLSSISIARHMFMLPGTNPNIDFEIPFIHPSSHLDIRTSSTGLGTLLLVVYNKLRFGASAPVTNVTLTIYGSFKNNEFSVLNPTTTSVVSERKVQCQGGVQTKAITNNYNLEHVMNASIDAGNGTSDSFQGGASDFKVPMDKPNICMNPAPALIRVVPNLANSVGIEFAQTLDLAAASLPHVTPTITGLSDNEMSLDMMLKTPCYQSTFQVASTDLPNAILFAADLAPCQEFFQAAINDTLDLSLLSFSCLPWSFWRGGIVFDLEVVASNYHNCKLMICSHYGFEADGLSVEESMGQYLTVFEVTAGVSTIKVVFPWRSPTQWKLVCNGSYADATPFSMGQMSVRLLSPLQYNETVTSTIDVNVSISGDVDFMVSSLGNNAIDVIPVDVSPSFLVNRPRYPGTKVTH